MVFSYGPVSLWDMTINERLRMAREKKYESAADAARAMGIKYPTYAGHENGNGGVSKKMAIRYAHFFGVDLEYLLTGRKPSATLESHPSPFSSGAMAVKGFIQAGAWQEVYRPQGEQTIPVGEILSHTGQRQYALEVHGESMNRRVRSGEYVICVEFNGTPKRDDVVVVERHKNGIFEATLKVVRLVSPDRMELWPDSNDAAHQTPMVITSKGMRDDETINITALVIGVFRHIKPL